MSLAPALPLITRRSTLSLLSAVAGLLLQRGAIAVEPEVPVRLQASLLDRIIPYDRKFAIRVHGQLSVAVVTDASSDDSVRVGNQLLSELSAREFLGKHRVAASRVAFAGAPALVDECRRLRAGVVWVTPGIREPIDKLAAALVGLRVLTLGGVPEFVPQGLILGFALRSSKPRILVNLRAARQQDVDFRADFLRMAEVFQ